MLARRQFLCGVNIAAGKGKELEGFSLSGPSDVVNVKTLADNGANPLKENVVINRIEYTDGAMWQRKAWNLDGGEGQLRARAPRTMDAGYV